MAQLHPVRVPVQCEPAANRPVVPQGPGAEGRPICEQSEEASGQIRVHPGPQGGDCGGGGKSMIIFNILKLRKIIFDFLKTIFKLFFIAEPEPAGPGHLQNCGHKPAWHKLGAAEFHAQMHGEECDDQKRLHQKTA